MTETELLTRIDNLEDLLKELLDESRRETDLLAFSVRHLEAIRTGVKEIKPA